MNDQPPLCPRKPAALIIRRVPVPLTPRDAVIRLSKRRRKGATKS